MVLENPSYDSGYIELPAWTGHLGDHHYNHLGAQLNLYLS